MKYYVNEKTYNTKGNLLSSSRITGDIEDIAWARKQMETRFQAKLIENRHSIKPGAIACSMTKCSMELKNGRYVIAIEEVPEKLPMKANEILIALCNKYGGDWEVIYKELHKGKDLDISREWLNKSPMTNKITLIDKEYPIGPKMLMCHIPFTLYYQGDISLVQNESLKRLCITVRRHPDETLYVKALNDIRRLPKDIVIVTSDGEIAKSALFSQHKVILVLACGVSWTTPQITETQKSFVVNNGGLLITQFPDHITPNPTLFPEKNSLMVALSDAVLIIEGSKHSSTTMIATLAVNYSKDIMVYPTFPENETINNELIKDGAYLVESTEDIINILK